MHDPLVVAFEIRRPWPQRSRMGTRRFYWPPMVTIWHREPRGHDSGEVCRHYIRWQDEAEQWHVKRLHRWRFHARHWKIQIHAMQELRRRLLTRCAWCGGRHRRRDPVNCSHSWDGPSGRWWQGEPGLYHGDCSSVDRAHALCLCEQPVMPTDGSGLPRDHGTCQRCDRFRPWRYEPDKADRLLASLPKGARIPAELRARLEALWAERRRRREWA